MKPAYQAWRSALMGILDCPGPHSPRINTPDVRGLATPPHPPRSELIGGHLRFRIASRLFLV
ncbi:hypothetical protein FKP32DRAFT_1590505 [Trametes sanguinea]|nr:hypothetical protein FKP32DRAFT_1590505 [Trametes sanguinea]